MRTIATTLPFMPVIHVFCYWHGFNTMLFMGEIEKLIFTQHCAVSLVDWIRNQSLAIFYSDSSDEI